MTRIDFYILQDVNLGAQHRFACRLAAQALAGGKTTDGSQPVILHTADEQTAREVDELLWHYPDRRFVPHAVAGDPSAGSAPVLITWQEPPAFDGVLFNLTSEVPHFFNRFHRVVEVVVQDQLDAGRERYRFYRHRGYPLYDHKLDEWETEIQAS
ncbi:MAG: DNA polymerase III subunit chi [Pseudomonadales bacterium]